MKLWKASTASKSQNIHFNSVQAADAQPCFSGAGVGGVVEVLLSSVVKLVMPFTISTLL
jgi:hypothetical protein